MWRFIYLGLIIWLVIYFLKRVGKQTSNSAKEQSSAPKENADENSEVENNAIENMVQCANCAVHLPRSESFLVDNHFYCCKAHIPK